VNAEMPPGKTWIDERRSRFVPTRTLAHQSRARVVCARPATEVFACCTWKEHLSESGRVIAPPNDDESQC
jgi:hypothetical protein